MKTARQWTAEDWADEVCRMVSLPDNNYRSVIAPIIQQAMDENPDTARLDWLESELDKGRLSVRDCRMQYWGAGKTLREAIDELRNDGNKSSR